MKELESFGVSLITSVGIYAPKEQYPEEFFLL